MMQEAPRVTEERSLGELLGDLSREITTLVRQEATLAKTEISQKAARVGKDVGFLAAGGAVAYAGFLTLVAGLVGILAAAGLSWWGAALIVGAVIAATGYFLVQKGLDALKREDLAPRETLESLKS